MKQPHLQGKNSRGISSVEIVIGVSILAVIVTFSIYAIVNFVSTAREVGDETQALYLAEEELELVRFLRDASWSWLENLPLNTPQYVAVSGTTISATTTPEIVGIFSRNFFVSEVFRDGSDRIVASTTAGAVADNGSRYVTAVVTFGSPTSTVSLTTILSDIDL